MSGVTHRIRRMTLQVRAATQTDALRARTELNAKWSDVLHGAFEQACDEIAPEGVVLRIPRLELRIAVPQSQVVSDLDTENVSGQLTTQLRDVRDRARSGAPGTNASASETFTSADDLDALLNYLETGALRWWDSGDVSTQPHRLQRTARSNLDAIVGSLTNRPLEESWFRLLHLMDGEYADLMDSLRTHAFAGRREDAITLAGQLRASSNATHHETIRAGASLLAEAFGGRAEELNAFVRGIPGAEQPPSSPLIASAEFDASKTQSVLQQPKRTAAGERDRLAVANAGLVLLHPFLPAVMSRAGLLRDNVISTEEMPRAAALLHHLTTGRTDVHEFELGLVKVLLGLNPRTPISVAEGLLSAADIAESDSMVAAAISHWNAIGNTSVAGMRSTFLSRSGLLALEEDGWTLHVESSPFDMLLDRLPWGFGVVRLPWMQRPLHTRWTH